MTFRATWILALAVLTAGCSKSENESKTAPSASVSAAPKASASAPAASAAPSAAPAAKAQATSYAGTYTLTPAKYYISDSKEFASVKQVKDDPSKLVGEGAITLSVDANGKVTGAVESGPLGPAIVDGSLLGEELRGNVRRKDPSDGGLTGVFSAAVAGDGATGTLSLAESNASIVREGKLTLKRK